MFDWQIILVGLALLFAGIYVGRRGWLRLSSLSTSKRMNPPSCADGCGGCGVVQGIKTQGIKEAPRTLPVQILRK